MQRPEEWGHLDLESSKWDTTEEAHIFAYSPAMEVEQGLMSFLEPVSNLLIVLQLSSLSDPPTTVINMTHRIFAVDITSNSFPS